MPINSKIVCLMMWMAILKSCQRPDTALPESESVQSITKYYGLEYAADSIHREPHIRLSEIDHMEQLMKMVDSIACEAPAMIPFQASEWDTYLKCSTL